MMDTTKRVVNGSLAALLAAFALTACDTVTEPGEFDALSTAASMEEMVGATQGMDEAWVGLELAGGLFEGSGAADVMAVAGRVELDGAAAERFASSYSTKAFFPSNYLGTTFVWSAAEAHYVASDESGAPADGIRVIYYAVDPTTDHPVEPLNALGYLELRDLSGAASDRLGIAVVRTSGDSPVTLADYFIDASYTQTSSSFSVTLLSEGFVSNGTDQLNFDLGQSASFSEGTMVFDQDFGMGLEGTPLAVQYEGTLTADMETEAASMDMTVTITGEQGDAVVHLTGDASAVSGTIHHSGVQVATISGTPDHPEFIRADGEPFTGADYQALEDLIGAVEDLMDLAESIFSPLDS